MPSKSWLLNTLSVPAGRNRTVEILNHAVTNYNIQSKLVFYRLKSDGVIECCILAEDDEEVLGSGYSKAESLADAYSIKHPS